MAFGVVRLAQLAEASAGAAGDCEDNCQIQYELVEITVMQGDGDPSTQTLWGHAAHFRRDPLAMWVFDGIDPVSTVSVGTMRLALEESP